MGKIILAVDDNQEFLDLIDLLLSNAGYQVRLANSAAEAMKSLGGALPDAILLDIMMPARNGIEFLENLRWDPHFKSIPVIVLTAMTLNTEEREFVEAYSTAILDKAHTPEVVDRLQQVLSAS